MTNLLLRLFVKNHNDSDSPAVRASIGKLAGIVGIICNCLLAVAKLLTGLFIGSISIIADALNNLSDTASSVVTLLGFRLAQRPADADHPYGHARYEYLSALVVAALILFIGVELIKTSISKILTPQPIVFSAITFGILLGSVAVKLWMTAFFSHLGTQIRSSALKATALDCRSDCIATSAILLSCLIGHYFQIQIDGWTGLIVALLILKSGFNACSDTVSSLLGKRADQALLDSISRLVLSHDKILGIHDLLVHDYGPDKCYASLHAELSCEIDALTCHDIIDRIERDAFEKLNVHMVIHPDPVTVNDKEWQEMRAVVEKLVKEIDANLAIHDSRVVKSDYLPRLVFDMDVPYSMHRRNDELQKEIDKGLADMGKNYITVIKFDGK